MLHMILHVEHKQLLYQGLMTALANIFDITRMLREEITELHNACTS